MQVDGVLSLPTGDENDDDSLFGSPPPSPARGRSPQLALPVGPGSAENVGAIALPGSHYCSELAIDPAVLLLNRPLSPRNPDTLTTTPLTPPPTLSSSHRPATSRGPSRASKNSKNGKERSATPHPSPPIRFPGPDEPLPSNFLRGQQGLLGHAGLIGGLDPSTLSTRYHRGSTSQNPIIIEDELDPPLLGKKGSYSLDFSSLPSPSSEEIISSLIKQKNIFPVLESLLRLLAGTGVPNASPAATPSCRPAPLSSNGSSNEGGPAPKRRRLNSVPAGAADWDVPYPFQQGEGPTHYRLHWEKERLKQLLSQLAVLVKGAKRSAAARASLQQHVDSSSSINLSKPASQISHQPQPTADVSPCEQHDAPTSHSRVRDVAPTPTVPECPRQALQNPAAPQTTPLDDFIASLLNNSIPRVSSPLNVTSFSPASELPPHNSAPASSHSTASDTLELDLQQLLGITRHSPSQSTTASTDSPGVTVPPIYCPNLPDQVPPHETPVVAGPISDLMIDPMLLGRSSNHNSYLVDPPINCTTAQGPSTPTLLQSPVASTSSLFDPLTPREDLCSEPDVYRPEQAEDPISAATLLLQIAMSAPPQTTAQSKTLLQPPTSRFQSIEPQSPVPISSPQPFVASIATTTPISSRAPSAAPRQGSARSAITPTTQILSLLDQRRLGKSSSSNKALNKQEVIQRAKDRRQQLLTELQKAKVELWEVTIEQGVLNHLMKDHGCL
ncbi:hypothetical protein BJV74DRAFT_818583 [Russula compacta]|nr:hypothetical protein BJV74DRAFT_818583 [Russula compacta]